MGLLGNLKNFKNSSFFPYLNTSTAFDITTCTYIKGWDGKYYMYGGVAPVTGVVGRNGYYKSTLVDYLISQLLRIYPFIDVYKLDTEQTMTSYERYEACLSDIMDYDQIKESVHITNKTETPFKDFMELIISIGEEKLKNEDKFTVTTPFLDRETGQQVKILVPTIIDIDSISELMISANEKILLNTNMEDSSSNTADLADGRIKKRLMSAMTVWARKYGIYFFVTAHVGDKKDLDKYKPEPSQNQWLSSSDKIKSAGNNFFFLPNLLFQCGKPSPIVNKEKEPIYPLNEESESEKIDLNYLPIKVLRNKTNFTGVVIPLVVTQSKGIDNLLTYFDFIKKKEFGLIKKGYTYTSPFLPNEKITRKNIRQLGDDYRLQRAMELTFQLCWINSYWNTRNMAVPIPGTVEELVSIIDKNLGLERVLESRGYWTYREDDPREYLSLFDIIEMGI